MISFLTFVTCRIDKFVTSLIVNLVLSSNFADKLSDIWRIDEKSYKRRWILTSSRQILHHCDDPIFQLRQRICGSGSSFNGIRFSLDSLSTIFGSFDSLPLHRFSQHSDDLPITFFFPFKFPHHPFAIHLWFFVGFFVCFGRLNCRVFINCFVLLSCRFSFVCFSRLNCRFSVLLTVFQFFEFWFEIDEFVFAVFVDRWQTPHVQVQNPVNRVLLENRNKLECLFVVVYCCYNCLVYYIRPFL